MKFSTYSRLGKSTIHLERCPRFLTLPGRNVQRMALSLVRWWDWLGCGRTKALGLVTNRRPGPDQQA